MPTEMPASFVQYAQRHGIAPERLQEALQWQVTLWSGAVTEQQRSGWRRWCDANPANSAAWNAIQGMAERLDEISVAMAPTRRGRFSRRGAIKALGIGAAALLITREVSQLPVVRRVMADHQNGVGPAREFALADGTRVLLNTASAIDVDLTSQRRRLVMMPGSEIFVDSRATRSTALPLLIETPHARVEILDDVAAIRDFGSYAQLAVREGQVRVDSGDGVFRLLHESQQSRLALHEPIEPTPLHAATLAWTKGMLLADRMSLGEFLGELGRYRRGILECDEQVAGLVVSGAYPLVDPNRILLALTEALPIRIESRTGYWLRVVAA